MENKKSTEEKPTFKPQYSPALRGAKIWMWCGVGIFALMIIVLWGWAMKIRLDAFSWQKTPESRIVNTAKTDWDKYFADTKALEENKIKIENALKQIVANADTATTTAVTSTPSVSATSTF